MYIITPKLLLLDLKIRGAGTLSRLKIGTKNIQ